MKVLMISPGLVASAYHGKLRELVKLGLELTVVVPANWGRLRFEAVKADGYELVVSKGRFTAARLGRLVHHLHYYPGISQVIGGSRWDMIHVDEEPFNFGAYHIMRACSRTGSPSVFFTWQNIMKKYPPPFEQMERYVFQSVSGAMAGSLEGLEVLRRRRFLKPAVVIPQFGVDPAEFCKQDANPLRRRLGLDESFVVGFIGRIVPEKGLETLFSAVRLLPTSCALVVVGSGPERSSLEAMADALNLSHRVRWVPWINSKEVAEYMNAFDALVLPSRTTRIWKEQFGRVLVEAMACETCVVGSDSGEIPNVIGDAGLIFHEGNERELAQRLRLLMDDASLRESLGRRGRERILQNFTHAKIAQETVSFYKQLCPTEAAGSDGCVPAALGESSGRGIRGAE